MLGFRLIHSVKSQAQWPRWFMLAGVTPRSDGGGFSSIAATWRSTPPATAWESRWKAP